MSVAATEQDVGAGFSPLAGRRLVVGIGEFAVSRQPGDVILTHALGSCVAVCLWDPQSGVAGLLHFLLSEARTNPARAEAQPGTFADTGIPLLFHTAYAQGLQKKSCRVWLIGGASITTAPQGMQIGRRNVLTAKNLLWKNGVLLKGEHTGGTDVRSVSLSPKDGRLLLRVGGNTTEVS